MRRFLLPTWVLTLLAITLLAPALLAAARAEPGPVPPGLIAGPGLLPGFAGPPAAAARTSGVPVGPFWRLPPPQAATRPPTAVGARLLSPPVGLPPIGLHPTAQAAPGLACRAAITAAETAQRIPPLLLQAIGIVESGRPAGGGVVLPWPWTVDVAGRGTFFPDKAQAIAVVRAAQAGGIRSIDVGCLQVNLLHHPHAFANLAQAFDPVANAGFAAGFLRRLFATTRDWAAAAAAYHSETPGVAAPYRARVTAAWARLGGPAVLPDLAGGPAPGQPSGAPFPAFTPLALAVPRAAGRFRILRAAPNGRTAPPGRGLTSYRARPIEIDRGG